MYAKLMGPLHVHCPNGSLALGGARQRALLGTLLLHANETVSTGQLVQSLWETPPARPESNLRTYISCLRRNLLRGGENTPRLLTTPAGYSLQVGQGELDLHRFAESVQRADVALSEGDHTIAADHYDRALALWGGRPLEGVEAGPVLSAELACLEERKIAAFEQRVKVKSLLGQQDSLVGDLRRFVSEYPLLEKGWCWLMLALSESGRKAEALQTFARARRTLIAELGVEPGPELRKVHQRVLADDGRRHVPCLTLRAHGRNDLPRDVREFVGRRAELAALKEALSDRAARGATIATITGMPGVGKTALAVHAAHQLAGHYPDCRLFVDLRAHALEGSPISPRKALAVLLRAVGVPDGQVPDTTEERAAMWRAAAARHRLLLVLDDASDEPQIRPLLPGAGQCAVLVTSRRRLPDLDAVHLGPLETLSPGESVRLLAAVAEERVRAEPAAAGELAHLCCFHPLALRLAASRLHAHPAWSVGHLVKRLLNDHHRLGELATRGQSVAEAIDSSWAHLGLREQQVMRWLGQTAGTGDSTSAGVAGAVGLSLAEAEKSLDELLDEHLIQQTACNRYDVHELMRLYLKHI